MRVVSMRTLIAPSLHLPKPQAQPSAAFFSFASIPAFSVTHSFGNFGVRKSPMDSRRSAVSSKASHSSAFSAPGEIHVVLGPMFSGKTTTLLRRILAEREIGRKTAIIKSNKDTRYSIESIVTHDGEKLPCWALPDLSSFRHKFGLDAYNQLDVIGIDEAQFFGDLYEFCREAADKDGKTVIIAGLDGDYLRRRFGSVLDIIPLADTVTKLTSRCEICGKKALFTLRKTEETETEVIGGAEVYMPVCRSHYVSGKGVMVTARGLLDSQCSLYT